MKSISEMGLSYDEAKVYVERYTCSCGSPLSLAWGGVWDIKEYIIRCGQDPAHSDFIRPHRVTLGNSPDMPGWKLPKERRQEMERELGTERSTKLMKYQGVAQLTKADARDIILTIWPKAPPLEVKKAMLICVQYNLNPLLKHIFLLGPFKNKKTGEETWSVALGIKADRTLASRQGRYSYYDDTPRIMTDEEQTKIFGKVDDSKLWAITKVKDEHGNTAQGYGFWPRNEAAYGEDKGNSPENMAMIRSERAALDRLFPDSTPANVELVDERYVGDRNTDITLYEPEGGEEESEPAQAKRKGGTVVQKERGKTGEQTSSPPKEAETQKSREASVAGEGFTIDLDWLRESQKELKWSDDLVKSFIVNTLKYKGDATGALTEVLSRLTREQAEDFTEQINSRLEKQPKFI